MHFVGALLTLLRCLAASFVGHAVPFLSFRVLKPEYRRRGTALPPGCGRPRPQCLVYTVEGANKATVNGFFDTLGAKRTRQLTHVTADGAPWLNAVISLRAPGQPGAPTCSMSCSGRPKPSTRCAGKAGMRRASDTAGATEPKDRADPTDHDKNKSGCSTRRFAEMLPLISWPQCRRR